MGVGKQLKELAIEARKNPRGLYFRELKRSIEMYSKLTVPREDVVAWLKENGWV